MFDNLSTEVERINNAVAEISSQSFFTKSIEERVAEAFATITPNEYRAGEEIWGTLHLEKRRLQREIAENANKLRIVEAIICQPFEGE